MNFILKGLLLVLAGIPLQAALPPHPRLLFDASGIQRLRERVRKGAWMEQWDDFRRAYDATLDQKIELPPPGSNWFHWYVCPRHGVRLTTGKQTGTWEWEHICPADVE